MSETCGLAQEVLPSVKASGKSGPLAMYAFQGYCPTCHEDGLPMKGRFFAAPTDCDAFDSANREWSRRKEGDLAGFWPTSEIPFGVTTHIDRPLPEHGFTPWWTMFNPRQLLIHAQLLKAIVETGSYDWSVREIALGVFQQYLRNENMFCFWNTQRALEPMFSNNNFAPKITVIENSVFSGLGRGDFSASSEKVFEALNWSEQPWEIASDDDGKHSQKVNTRDPVLPVAQLECSSATALTHLEDASFDLVVTDPPFGGLLHYSELADLFYVWLRLALKEKYPEAFGAEYCPKALEAVANKARQPKDHDAFYQRLLTECWREARRILKPSGILAFTFHHSEDDPWVAVLESLFDAGFYLEATYPIRSDETKGDGDFGSQKIEYDIIHVCRKQTDEPETVSWAKLRRQVMRDVRDLEDLLSQHQSAGLQQADLQVIRRGKALEHFSRHYGKVYVEKGREFTVKEALVGINSLLEDEQDTATEAPPVLAEPFTRQFLRLFAKQTSLERDQVQKFLRGTGVSPGDFVQKGWCSEKKKVFYMTHPLEMAQEWKGVNRNGMARDFDQAMFLIGACYENSGIRVHDTLNSQNFAPHPAIPDLLDWFIRHGGDPDMKQAAQLAKRLYSSWLSKNQPKVEEQLRLFDLGE